MSRLLPPLLLLPGLLVAESALPDRARSALADYQTFLQEQERERIALERSHEAALEKARAKLVSDLKRALSRRSEVAEQAAVYKAVLSIDRNDQEARTFFQAIGTLEQVLTELDTKPVAVDLVAGNAPGAAGPLVASLPDAAFSASSGHNPSLFSPFSRYSSAASWSLGAGLAEGWLQIDLGQERSVVAVGSKGRGNHAQWVTSYGLQFSRDGKDWASPTDAAGQDLVFEGNVDQQTERRHDFPRPVRARYVRFLPLTWHGYASMRVEVYGW